MRPPRLRFSVRALLAAMAVLATVLAVSVQFGPHLAWKTFHSKIASGVAPIPSKPLIASRPAEDLITCRIGPVSLELPKPMAGNVEVHRGMGGIYVQFSDGDRTASLFLPRPANGWLQEELAEFPEKAQLTFPRLQKEVTDAQSSDFSFGMSHQKLRWHRWLLEKRSQSGVDFHLVEYLWRPDLEGNLVSFSSSSPRNFQWETVDRKWEGSILFSRAPEVNADWIRHACATFVINGDPRIFRGRNEAAINSMIEILDSHQPDDAQPPAQ